jgi:hypothetical protein
MDEQLQKALADILNKTVGAVEQGGKSMLDQLPDVINEFLYVQLLEKGFALGLSLAIALLLTYFSFVIFRGRDNSGLDVELFLTSALFGLIAYASSIYYAYIVVKIVIFPKIFLIEYAASLVK